MMNDVSEFTQREKSSEIKSNLQIKRAQEKKNTLVLTLSCILVKILNLEGKQRLLRRSGSRSLQGEKKSGVPDLLRQWSNVQSVLKERKQNPKVLNQHKLLCKQKSSRHTRKESLLQIILPRLVCVYIFIIKIIFFLYKNTRLLQKIRQCREKENVQFHLFQTNFC